MIIDDYLHPTVRALAPSATLRINEESQRLIREGRDIIRLGLGQSPFPVPDRVVQALKAHAHEKDYLPVAGLAALRQAVAAYYQQGHVADDVLIGPGSKELLYNLQAACQGELLLPAPSWVSYAPQALLLGRRVRYLPTRAEDQWQLQPEQLDQLGQASEGQIRILVLNYPSNPTGCSYDGRALKALGEAARRQNILVVADEIYAQTHFSGGQKSIADYYPEGTVISSGLSKWCGAGGWRLGTMVFPSELRSLKEAMAVIASETFTSVSAPVQYASCEAFTPSADIEAYLLHSRRVLKAIAGYLCEKLGQLGLAMVKPVGGFYLLVSFEQHRSVLSHKGILTSEALCEHLLQATGVALLPGSDFGLSPDQLYVRLAYVDFDGAKALKAAQQAEQDALAAGFVEAYCPKLVTACQRVGQWLDQEK